MSTITMTAKELKNRTGDAFRVLPFELAWQEIEGALEASEPAYSSIDEAMSASRRRPRSARS